MNILMMSASSREKLKGAYPEELEEGFHLNRETTGTVIKFNHLGNIFAVGCFDGTLSIYDSDTLSQISQFRVAKTMVSNIEWYIDYTFIMCSERDAITIWNVIEKECIKRFPFPGHVITRAYICPADQNLILICTDVSPPLLLNTETEERRYLPIKLYEYKNKSRQKDLVGGPFSPDGKYIFIGNTMGQIVAINTHSLKVVPHNGGEPFHISGEANVDLSQRIIQNRGYFITQIAFSKKGKYIAVNTQTTIYVFLVTINVKKNSEYVEYAKIFELPSIHNEPFYLLSFIGTSTGGASEDSDYLIATKEHNIHIYDYISGDLMKILDCPLNERVISLECHPQTFKYIRPLIVTGTTGGNILFWTKTIVENWSAFSPEFDELECNELYIERENEYDEDCDANVDNKPLKLLISDVNDPNIIIDIFERPSDMPINEYEQEAIYIPTAPLRDGEEDDNYFDHPQEHEEKPQRKKPKRRHPPKKKRASYSSDDDDDDDEDYFD
ncbi:hypothetical protein C9374_004969 [Naegleria lovaniensis]|uniref:Anaphase-promoting complex subunit 4-like WD40 domain-containing protein n=1 Tax=Naegleria lovaniensis TaxID=51637 RepID=A0AA88GRH7_NAELO|nr:uncharacterized protein C9374_004969 [Naegleria lovaniensis]KAG2383002.1 hypothetical protein C9374_004969 [Naegleria lovaniensis]